MRKLMMLASAVAMTMTMPAMAEAQGKGKGKGASVKTQTSVKKNKSNVQARSNVNVQRKANRKPTRSVRTAGRLDANGNGILDRYERDSDGDGILDYREGNLRSTLDRNNNGILDRYESGSRLNFCPPGLSTKTPACIPPGQAARVYAQGQRLPTGYRYVEVPVQYQTQINDYDPARYRYYYNGDRTVYVVDPATSLISRVISLAL